MAELQDFAQVVAQGVLNEVQTALADEWDSVSEQTKDDIKLAALRIGQLTLEAQTGKDVTQKVALLKSIVLDFKAAGKFKSAVAAEKAQRAFWEGVGRVAEGIGTFLKTVAIGGLKGLTGGVV